MTSQRILWYFADPMCSWCWGFAPVISAIRDAYADRVKIALMLGGLRPGTTEPMMPKGREEILQHWRDVHRMTGQAFIFDGALPGGFVYDTEPPSRAVIAVGEISPEAVFPYFKSVQEAFYAHGRNVVQTDTLADLAQQHNIESRLFLDRFHSEAVRNKTRTHFEITRQSGVRGFPTVLLQDGAGATGLMLTNGYRPFAELQPVIENWLAAS
ncbi:protein-disulfide isomerase [Sulfuricaulis limicola]|uniref:Protein-disulfide isomerase n=1 Tax=Sulfuricaulis limicola TaxID=1620215 RepID=A0A1B4XDI3_9GAMM|nr:DsbA family protein [Sulfuricaulis limicola]BAV32840.1 protein-disulfide isomerase [Sulfuricaulis limicola]